MAPRELHVKLLRAFCRKRATATPPGRPGPQGPEPTPGRGSEGAQGDVKRQSGSKTAEGAQVLLLLPALPPLAHC
eukprot:9487642-Pyramimonas_sp.AAC.1